MKSFVTSLTCLVLLVVLATSAQAMTLETVPVGNEGNIGDTEVMTGGLADGTTGHGAVDYAYNIGKYEVTAGQYSEFLNAVAATDTYGLYNPDMSSSPYGCQITQNGISGNYTYDFSGRPSGDESDWTNRPVNEVSWGDAARFANWLHNGQPTGVQDLTTTEDGAYYLNGATSNVALMAVSRDGDWKWAIPTEDEWYKAAYHKNDGATGNYFDYPTSSDSVPSNDLIDPDPGNNANFYQSGYTIGLPYMRTEVGEFENSESPYGTFDQGGNLWEMHETAVSSTSRGSRGSNNVVGSFAMASSFHIYIGNQLYASNGIGFRVVSVHEPSIDVSIDIKPGSDPNSINLGSNGNIPVAIFGTDAFDVRDVDLTTIMLADAGVMERGKKGDLMASFEDIDLDGLLDLLIHIDTQGLVLSDGDVEALLTGETFDGVSISGTDAINLVGSSGGQHPATFTNDDAPPLALSGVPEPGCITLLLSGLASLICLRRRK